MPRLTINRSACGIRPIWGPRLPLALGSHGFVPLLHVHCHPRCPGYLPQVVGALSLRLVVETEFSGGARAVWLDPHMLLVGSGWI